jgi:hypothetical protein
MPTLDLTNDEMQRTAMACRIGAARAERDAARQENPRIKATFAEAAALYMRLSERFEKARE